MSEESTLHVFEHLDELRKRLVISLITVVIGFLICFYYSDKLLHLLKLPLENNIRVNFTSPFFEFTKSSIERKLYFIAPAEAFWSHLKIAIIFSILFSFPVIISQAWAFIKPALFKDERRLAFPLIFSSIILFVMGLLFCALIVLPFAMDFLLTYKTSEVIPMLTLEHYIDFTLKFLLAFGVIFQTPVIIVVLTKLNILTPEMLKKNRKYAILIIFIVAAILTPTPDVFNQCLMALPLMILYEISIIFSSILYKKKERINKSS